ncbi:MAG: fibronectin type III domain-containing protein [Phycisphaerae bacterium]
MRAIASLLVVLAAATARPQDLPVFQDLDEVTGRIPNLMDKPYARLIEANGGFLQSEALIFKDVQTGHEVWSLSREECTDMAHTGRRPAWSTNGQYLSYLGNVVFLNAAEGNKLWNRTWAGYTYISEADGSKRRPLYGTADGKVIKFNAAKYNAWDAKKPGVWYTVNGDTLWRLTIAPELAANKAEGIYKFPNAQPKTIQELCDANYMLVEESGAAPNCYVVNLNKDPKDGNFCMTAPLKGAIHSGSFRFHRTTPLMITGGYEKPLAGGVCFQVDDAKGLVEAAMPKEEGAKVEMAHLWYGPPDDRVGFFGRVDGKDGLWVRMPGKAPVMLADVPDGHVTWCGRDPEWFFAAVGPGEGKDSQYIRKLIACNIDGKTIKTVCTPFDRRRPGGEKDYGAIPLPTESRDGTKCWFHSSMLLSTSKHTGSYIAVFRRPYAPTELKLKVGAGVELEWTPHAVNSEVKGFHVYRSDDDGKTFVELTDKAIDGRSYKDATAQNGKAYIYAVTAEEWSRLESDTTSPTLKVELAAGGPKAAGTGTGVKGWDKTAPAAVKELKATLKDGLITLQWPASAERDLRYYNIYASSAGKVAPAAKPEISQKRLLVSPPHDETSYIDWTAPKDKTVSYAITVVDRQGNESSPAYAAVESPATAPAR